MICLHSAFTVHPRHGSALQNPKSWRWFLSWRVGKKLFNHSMGTADKREAEKQLAA
jgi:hypothetical protein